VHAYRIAGGKVVEMRSYQGNATAEDRFWS
jgi:hypothetical protein